VAVDQLAHCGLVGLPEDIRESTNMFVDEVKYLDVK
jgi:hypothetical protein